MNSTSILLVLSSLHLIVYSGEAQENYCGKYETGIHPISIEGKAFTLAVSKAKPNLENLDSINLALALAENNSKLLISKHIKSSTLKGIRKLFTCNLNDYYYVGLITSDIEKAKSLSKKIKDSITSVPTLN